MTDSVSQRFSKLLKEINLVDLRQKEASEIKQWAAAAHALDEKGEPDFGNITFHEMLARVALTLSTPTTPVDAPIAKAFAGTGLDPRNPFHWRWLMTYFCWAHFGPRPKRGRPKVRVGRYSQLVKDFFGVKNGKPNLDNVEVCRILKQRYPERYGKPREQPSAERIAKEVNKAQDPKCNPALANLVNTFIQLSRFEHAKKRIAWNADIESKKTKGYIDMVTKLITSKRPEKLK